MLLSDVPCVDIKSKEEIDNTMCREVCHKTEEQIYVPLEACRQDTFCCKLPARELSPLEKLVNRDRNKFRPEPNVWEYYTTEGPPPKGLTHYFVERFKSLLNPDVPCVDIKTKNQMYSTMCRKYCLRHLNEEKIKVPESSCREDTYCCQRPVSKLIQQLENRQNKTGPLVWTYSH